MRKATKNLLIFEIKKYIAQHYIQNKESDWLEIRFSLKDGAQTTYKKYKKNFA